MSDTPKFWAAIGKNRKKLQQFSGILMIFGVILLLIPVFITIPERKARETYWNQIALDYSTTSIPVGPGVEMKALILNSTNSSVLDSYKANGLKQPLLINLNGINARKERFTDFLMNFVQLGFLVVCLEQVGHGQSGGKVNLLGREPMYVSKAIDYLITQYPSINATHIAVSGFSYGAGTMLIAQALDDRIYCSTLFHPLSNVSRFLEGYSLDKILGKSIFGSTVYDSSGADQWASRNALFWCTANNTKNLMLIQGLEDDTVNPADNIQVYNALGGSNRTDLMLIKRPGLGHGGNERDNGSRKYAVAWISAFYGITPTAPLSETELNNTISTLILASYNPPATINKAGFFILGMVLLIVALWIFDLLYLAPVHTKDQQKPTEKLKERIDKQHNIKVRLGEILLVLTVVTINVGFIIRLTDPSLLMGFLVWIPLIGSVILVIYWSHQELISWSDPKQDLRLLAIGILTTMIPIIISIFLFDWTQIQLLQSPLWPWKLAWLYYCGIIGVLVLWGMVLFVPLNWNKSEGIGIKILLIFTPFVMGFMMTWIFTLFNPIPLIPRFEIAQWAIILLGGLLPYIGAGIGDISRKLWHSSGVGIVLLAFVITAIQGWYAYQIFGI